MIKIIGGIAIGIVVVVAIVVIGGGTLLSTGGGSGSVLDQLVEPTVSQPAGQYENKVTFDVGITIEANSTSVTDDGNPIIIRYYEKLLDGTLSHIATSSDGTAGTIDFVVGENNLIYVEIEHPTTPVPAVYIDALKTENANPEFKSGTTDFKDVDRNNRPSFLFVMDISKVKQDPKPALQPSILWGLKVHGDGDADINTATSLTSVGQGDIENVVEWTITFDAQPNAYAIVAFDIRINATDNDNYIDEGASWVDMPNRAFDFGIERVFFTDMTETQNSGITTYRHEYCNPTKCLKIDGANLLTVANTGSKKLDVDVTVTTKFDATDEGLCIELSFDKIDARNTITSNEMIDDAQIDEGTGGSGACTIT